MSFRMISQELVPSHYSFCCCKGEAIFYKWLFVLRWGDYGFRVSGILKDVLQRIQEDALLPKKLNKKDSVFKDLYKAV